MAVEFIADNHKEMRETSAVRKEPVCMAIDRIVIEIEGLMLEKLICRALSEGAEFFQIERPSRRLVRIEAASKSAKLVLGIAEKYHLTHRIVSVHGLSALKARIRARATIAAAFITMFVLCGIYFSRIWIIDVELIKGDALPAGVDSVLAESGIITGTRFGEIDLALASLRLKALPGCAHASVSRRGVRVIAEIAMEEPAPELYSIEGSGDLIALCDGVIASVNVKSGTAMVKVGDTVRCGQVLISGYERTGKDSVRDVAALGSVTARIWVTGEAESPATAIEKRYTGRSCTSSNVTTPWFDIALTRPEAYEMSDIHVEKIPVCGLFIPLYIERAVHTEYALFPVDTDTDALKAYIQAISEKNALQNAPESAEIIDKWTDFSMIESDDIIHARTVVEMEMEIAVARGYMEENQIE